MGDEETTDYSVAASIYHVVAYIRWMRRLDRLGQTHKHTSSHLRSEDAETETARFRQENDFTCIPMHTYASITHV